MSRCLLPFCLALLPPVVAQAMDSPNWDKSAALQVAEQAEKQQLAGWLRQVDAGQGDAVLAELQQSPALGTPALESQLHFLAQALAEAPLVVANERLLDWLQDYQPQVLVAHEEFGGFGVPLYPVTAAARGSAAERQRRAAQQQTDSLLANPALWLEAYLAASPIEQQGLEQGLRQIGPEQLAPLAGLIHSRLADHPQLAKPAGLVASALLDTGLFLAAYRHSRGADSVELLREASWRLDAAQRSRLISGILAVPDPAQSSNKTALGISLLAPGLRGNPEISNQLLQLLDNPQLGAAAALALAGHPDPQVQASLRSKLDGDGLASQRAALALGLPVLDETSTNPPATDSLPHSGEDGGR